MLRCFLLDKMLKKTIHGLFQARKPKMKFPSCSQNQGFGNSSLILVAHCWSQQAVFQQPVGLILFSGRAATENNGDLLRRSQAGRPAETREPGSLSICAHPVPNHQTSVQRLCCKSSGLPGWPASSLRQKPSEDNRSGNDSIECSDHPEPDMAVK